MKQKKLVLKTAVIAALLSTPFLYFHVNEALAAGLPSENFTTTGTVTTGDYDGHGTFTWTQENQNGLENGQKQGDIILSTHSSSLVIKDLNSLNFKEQLDENATNTAHSVDGALKAAEDARVTIQNVKTINFGDNDHVLKADQGFHAYGGTIDVTADNIYGNVRGSGFLMNQSVRNQDNIHQGTLIIHANKDINLTSNYRGLVGVQSYQNTPGDTGTAKTSITADGTIGLHVTGAEEKKQLSI